MNNDILFNFLKENDPGFKKYIEEEITINRENFNKALVLVYDFGSDSPASDVIELTEISDRLWALLREYHV